MSNDQREKDIHRLALRIRQGISESGIYNLDAAEMALIWQQDHQELSDSEKRMHVKNFATQFGFAAMIDFDIRRAVFIHAN